MATVEVDDAAVPQHMLAIRRAQASRLAGVAVKAELRAGTLTLADAIEDPRAGVLPVMDLLMALPQWGRWRASRLLAGLAVPDGARVRDLAPRQRRAIVERCGLVDTGGQSADPAPQAPTPPPAPPAPPPAPALPPARVIRELVGRYSAHGEQRRLLLVAEHGGRMLVDRGRSGDRIVERFGAQAGLLEIAAVAQGYLDERRDVAA